MKLFTKRAAIAVIGSRELEIATKYQSMLPAECREVLRLVV